MMLFLTILAFFLIFSALILIHEWGHFFVARKNNIKVEEFGFGLPPRIWGFKKGETLYSLNAIPFGGFVRLYGEDASSEKMRKNPRSFIHKPPRVRIMVVIAGVVMNFLLAFVLLTIGFIVGIEPLIINSDDFFQATQNGIITTQDELIVKKVESQSPASNAGLQPQDHIITINDKKIVTLSQLEQIIKNEKGESLSIDILRSQGQFSEKKTLQIVSNPGQNLGFSTYEVVFLPRLKVYNLPIDSSYYQGGLRSNDIILEVNGLKTYEYEEFQRIVQESGELRLRVLRGDDILNFRFALPQQHKAIISDVTPDGPAAKAGLQSGDVVTAINGQYVFSVKEVMDLTKKSPEKKLQYMIERNGEKKEIVIIPNKEGLINISLSDLIPYQNFELSFFRSENVPLSILNVEKVRYPFWIAPFKSLEECFRLATLTVQGFGNLLNSLFTRLTIPSDISGPVGIFQMTSKVIVEQGIFSLLRLMALLSLTLAIMNVLPVPALDGGRLFFIVVEVLIGHRIGARYESLIHAIGFVLLLLLIAAVTFQDIVKLF